MMKDTEIICANVGFSHILLSACCWPSSESTPEFVTLVLLVNRCSTARWLTTDASYESAMWDRDPMAQQLKSWICFWMASQIPNPTRPTSCFMFALFFFLAVSRRKNRFVFFIFFRCWSVGAFGMVSSKLGQDATWRRRELPKLQNHRHPKIAATSTVVKRWSAWNPCDTVGGLVGESVFGMWRMVRLKQQRRMVGCSSWWCREVLQE